MDKHRKSPISGRRQFMAGSVALPWIAAMSGCGASSADTGGVQQAGNYLIDRSFNIPNPRSRVKTLVLHYTAQPLDKSLALLTDPLNKASAHYVVPDAAGADRQFRIYELVPEVMMAGHAGISYWQGERMLNAGSIGVELVNPGFPEADELAPLMNRRWHAFPDVQITALGELVRGIVQRHNIAPHRIVGHADVAPGRKFDPGPLFPWQRLHDEFGIGAWPLDDTVRHYANHQPYRGDVQQLQAKLLAYGYGAPQTGVLDEGSQAVVASFQMHFRPARYDGQPDVETVAILDTLLENMTWDASRQPLT